MSEHRDLELGVLGFESFTTRPPLSAADPEVLARAVRAHKVGDAFAQAALTFALMLAIGAVAFVLSAERAAAASLLAGGALTGHVAAVALAAVCAASFVLLLAGGRARRRAEVRASRRDFR